MVRWVVGSILHGVDPLSYFSFQPVLHDWCNDCIVKLNISYFHQYYIKIIIDPNVHFDLFAANEFGQGVYFTKTAELAVQKYCKEDSQNQKYLFLSKVITGEYAKSTSSQIRVPPCIDKTKPEVLYDSVVDDSSDPTTFVIFNDTQAYPEYLIVVQS